MSQGVYNMTTEKIYVPDIGDYQNVDVIEVNVSDGDQVEQEDSLITLETDKASMEIPSPQSGQIVKMLVKEGDKVSQGDPIAEIQASASSQTQSTSAPSDSQSQSTNDSSTTTSDDQIQTEQTIEVPDIGDYQNVDVIEVNVSEGDTFESEDSLITLETDKASMEIPAPYGGKIVQMLVKEGDKVSQGDSIAKVVTQQADQTNKESSKQQTSASQDSSESNAAVNQKEDTPKTQTGQTGIDQNAAPDNHNAPASPAVRRLARILGVDLNRVTPTGRKGRITKDDCNAYIKQAVTAQQQGKGSSGNGLDLLPDPEIDFEKFGPITKEPLSRINKISAQNLSRNWVKIPHVTFYDEADITDLEAFRKAKKAQAEKAGVKLTPLAFLIKAAAKALQMYPRFNSSLSNDGENLIIKEYFNIGFAADTPKGLVVPVIKNADQKSIFEISSEVATLAGKAKDGKLKPEEMKGATFTISSLGVLGTTAFTPIINMPEVAILGVSKSQTKPVWDGSEFQPRTMLPLSLSTDHRVIDGALAAKFLTQYNAFLEDLRELLL